MKADPFYATREWRQLRYQALKAYGGRCQCCGSPGPLHVDHIKPRWKFPHLSLVIGNLQVLCEDCNIGKGGHDQTDWRRKMKRPWKPSMFKPKILVDEFRWAGGILRD